MSAGALERLCALCGIEPAYHDVWGNQHQVSAATQRALLAAMGIAATDDASVDSALRLREERRWRRALAPVQVVKSTDAVALELVVPQARAAAMHEWVLQLEGGQQLSGQVRPAEFALIDEGAVGGTRMSRYRWPLRVAIGVGYHRLQVTRERRPVGHLTLIVTPPACYAPEAIVGDGKVWGPALQLYALCSRRGWGIGDYSDLRTVVEASPALGASLVGLNPLHALYPSNPEHASPYSPSSRLFLNIVYIDVEAVPEFAACAPARERVQSPQFQARLHALRESKLVDYAGATAVKREVLELLYRDFRANHLARDSARARAFRAFQSACGEALLRHARFEALQEHFHSRDASVWGWPAWPATYHACESAAVAEFAAQHAERVEFHQYLQWLADEQLGGAGLRALELELGVGLYLDLALSADRGGAEVWANRSLYAADASIGAPPDDFNLNGQDWGLPPLIPEALTESAYAPFIAAVRASMRHAGALRIDHVMALLRLFWIPKGGLPADGAYVHYPFEDLLGIVALESERNRCAVIGEDLGTVPDAIRAALAPRGVLSYRLFYFERNADNDFKPPAEYPAQALAAVSNHDLPTLWGYWSGVDIAERTTLNLFPSEAIRDQQLAARADTRTRMLVALKREELLPAGESVDPASRPEMTPELARAVHAYVARSPARIMLVQAEDVLGQQVQVNLPGTTDQRPNWRIKVALPLEELLVDPRLRDLAAALRPWRGPALAAGDTQRRHHARIPRATYRLQFNRDFTFRQAQAIVPYLARLGVSHIYASPYLKARAGSRHGYDIVDHNALNPEIGTREEYDQFVAAVHAAGMGQILDMVPNHMGVTGDDNQWWLDVLENGQASLHAGYFDIDWRPGKEALRGKVLLPVLGDHYGRILERGELRLGYDGESGGLAVRYHSHLFPIDPRSYPLVFGFDIERLQRSLEPEDAGLLEYQSLITAFRNLPPHTTNDPDRVRERNRDKEVHKRRLLALARSAPGIHQFIEENVAVFNGGGDIARYARLHELLEAQAYRLAYWRVASDEINYRRFFDINELAGLRMENPEVFEATHRLVLDLVARGQVDGLRVDHTDGLYDPRGYFERLQRGAGGGNAQAANGATAASSNAVDDARPLYLVIEKILAPFERLPEQWAIHGTTGYDFATQVDALQVYGAHEAELTRIYERFTGQTTDFDALVYDRKRLVMRAALSSELHVLAARLDRLSESDPHTRDYTLTTLRHALGEVVANFPVYRTYATAEGPSAEDARYVEWAVGKARKRSLATDASVFDFIGDILLGRNLEGKPEAYRRTAIEFVMRFQQYTGPVMAKGLEDTSFYIYNRLASLNDVGGDPQRFSLSITAFHAANQERLRKWPYAMLTTSTHDSKRGEDVRARINVLSELPAQWWTHLMRWGRLHRSKKLRVDGQTAPDRNDEYLFYETVVGLWPVSSPDAAELAALRERVAAYMLKAIREAKVHTSWINPDAEYERAMLEFVNAALAAPAGPFVSDLAAFVAGVARLGALNGLSRTLLKLSVPGVPDIYQGNELSDLSLVDPDNRRPVDYVLRERELATLEAMGRDAAGAVDLSPLLRSLEDGRAKLYVTAKTLALRRERDALFRDGEYLPLVATGIRAEHVCAFARRRDRDYAIVVAPRWFAALAGAAGATPVEAWGWGDTRIELPEDAGQLRYVDAYTGIALSGERENERYGLGVARVLARFPVALLYARANGGGGAAKP